MRRVMIKIFNKVLLVSLFFSATVFCDVKLPRLVSDGMILQRDVPVNIWGWASPGEKVTVNFLGKTYSQTTGADGKWLIKLPALNAGGPYDMAIEGNNKLSVKNILIGDVWVCSGQSNMVLPVSRVRDLYEDEIASSQNDMIREFTVPMKYDFHKRCEDVQGGSWISANPTSVLSFSATAYFFARNLFAKYHIPIGLISACIGGTPVDAWISEETVKKFPESYEVFKKFQDSSYVDQVVNGYKKLSDAWYSDLNKRDLGYAEHWSDTAYDASSWSKMNIPCFWDEGGVGAVNGVVWFRKEFNVPKSMAGKPARLNLGRIVDSDSAFVNGVFVGNITYQYPPRIYKIPAGILKEGKNLIVVRVVNVSGRGGFIKDKPYDIVADDQTIDLKGEWSYRLGATAKPLPDQTFIQYKPVGLFNGMIAPLLHYTIKGVIWYQGESDTFRAKKYEALFSSLIDNWREDWGEGNFPFLFVQLPNFLKAKDEPSESDWAEIREAQLKTLSLPNTAMVVIIDSGEWNDIHPLKKKIVGDRLALAAEKLAYGETNIVASGPIYQSMEIEGDKVILSFSNTGSGLIAKGGGELKQFAIAGQDKNFVWAKAIIKGDKVIVWSDQIKNPYAVRYAWADNPAGANLYNKEGLPASPFRTDN